MLSRRKRESSGSTSGRRALSFKFQMLLIVAVPCVATGVAAVLGLNNARSAVSALEVFRDQTVPAERLASATMIDAIEMMRLTTKAAASSDPAERTVLLDAARAHAEQLVAGSAELRGAIDPEFAKNAASVAEAAPALTEGFGQAWELLDRNSMLATDDAIMLMDQTLAPQHNELIEAVEAAEADVSRWGQQRSDKLTASLGAMKTMLLVGPVVAILLAACFGLLVSWRIIKGLRSVRDGLLAARQNLDLTATITGGGARELTEVARTATEFIAELNGVMRSVEAVGVRLGNEAGGINDLSRLMLNQVGEQSQRMTQAGAAIEQMSASINEVAGKTGQVAEKSRQSGEMARTGGQVVEDTIQGMASINQAVGSAAESIRQLGDRSEQIGEVIAVINDIADQTNLLALNAAIEAARAGEHGRGFAVVADEVRKLADRTTLATKEIAGSITSIQQETQVAVQKIESGTEQVQGGVDKAVEAGDSLRLIVDAAGELQTLVNSIAAATEQQGAASNAVSEDVESVAGLARESGEQAERVSNSAEQIKVMTGELNSLLARFEIGRG